MRLWTISGRAGNMGWGLPAIHLAHIGVKAARLYKIERGHEPPFIIDSGCRHVCAYDDAFLPTLDTLIVEQGQAAGIKRAALVYYGVE